MSKKILFLMTGLIVSVAFFANNSQAATTVMTYNRPSNTLYNGENQILTVNFNSDAEKVYLKNFKISCQHNITSDFAIKLKDSQGNILANSTAASGNFGSIDKEFTGAIELKVFTTLTGLTIPYDQNIIVCSVNNGDVNLLNFTTGDLHNPNVAYSTVNNVSLSIINISNSILPNTKAAEIVKYNFNLDKQFILDKITMECSSADISNIILYDASNGATVKTGVVSNSSYINSWAKVKYVFSGLNYPVGSNNLSYSFKADIPSAMASQTLKCAITSEYSAKTLSGASQAINIGSVISEVNIQSNQLDITYNVNNPKSSLSLNKGLKDYAVLWLNAHADSVTDLTITSATFKKYGSLSNNYISKISLYGNLRKFIQAKDVMASDTIFFTGMNCQIKAAETHDLILEIDTTDNAESNKDFYFYLTDLQAIDANGTTVKINATLPLQGNIMRIAESSVIYKPDLIISGVTYSKRTDGLYDVKATVKNTGDAEAKGSFKVMAYQSSVHNYYKMVPADAVIVAGGYSEISFTLEAGGYVFMADYDNIILEKDENNNNWESNIAGADSTINSPITVLSPNGGEQLVQGQTSRIAWRGGNYPVQVAVVRSTFPADLTVAGDISLQANPDGYIDWDTSIISSRSPNGKRWIDPGQYKIVVYAKSPEDFYCFDSTDPSVCTYDVSDASFSVAAASITLAPSPAPVSSPTPTPVPSDCLPDNTLVKMPDDPKVYVIINCQKKWIQTAEEFKEEGYKWTDVKEVNSPVVQAYADYLQAGANLLQAIGQQKVYRVVNNKVLWIPTIAAFNAQGLKWSGIQSVNESDLVKYPRAKLVQVAGDPKVYYITESGLKKHIANETVFDSYNNKWSDVVTVDVAIVNSYPDANLIKAEDGYQVYKIENGQKRWIKTDAAFRRLKLDWNKVAPVNNTELAAYPDGAVIE